MLGEGWTNPGCKNQNCQINLGRTSPPRRGSGHLQNVYVMHCPCCELNYGANGADIWLRKCPFHQEGKPGEPFQGDEVDWRP